MGKKEVLALADYFSKTEDGVNILFDLCLAEEEKLSFHAAWVLENVITSNPDLFGQYLPKIIDTLPTLKSQPLQRHFCKLINLAMQFCSKNELQDETCLLFETKDMESIIEMCFEWLMDPAQKPAVKAHCMDILLYLSRGHKWIADELPYVIEVQLINGTPGIISKGKNVLMKLRKKI